MNVAAMETATSFWNQHVPGLVEDGCDVFFKKKKRKETDFPPQKSFQTRIPITSPTKALILLCLKFYLAANSNSCKTWQHTTEGTLMSFALTEFFAFLAEHLHRYISGVHLLCFVQLNPVKFNCKCKLAWFEIGCVYILVAQPISTLRKLVVPSYPNQPNILLQHSDKCIVFIEYQRCDKQIHHFSLACK